MSTMFILPDDETFVPHGFLVCDFYGDSTCFCWCKNRLVMFPYPSSTTEINILTSPAPIIKVQCFTGRIFVICKPSGIYKLWRDLEFAVLSKSGLGIGTVFYEVLHIIDNCLHLTNKQKKTNESLFTLSSVPEEIDKLCTFPLSTENVDDEFGKVLWDDGESGTNCCIIANGRKVFKLVNKSVKIVHCCENSVTDVLPVWNDDKIAGLILVVGSKTVVVMYHRNEELVFDKVHLGAEIAALCAGVSQGSKGFMWIVHSDTYRLHYVRKSLTDNTVRNVKTEAKRFVFLQYYKNMILGLSDSKQLHELPISAVESLLVSENEDFTALSSGMLKGSEIIVNKICDRAQELSSLNRVLLAEQDKLRRVNLYAYEQRVKFCPKMLVQRISNRSFLTINFQDFLTKNSTVVVRLESKLQSTFCAKNVVGPETVVEMFIPDDAPSSSLKITIDLITLTNESSPWCIIGNYINDVPVNKKRKGRSKKDKTAFINAKIELLMNLMKSGNLDIKKLSEIKKSVRKEMGDV